MNQKLPETPPQQPSPETKDLQSLLQKQFEEVFSRHPKLTLDQAFYLQAARLHHQVLVKIAKVHAARRDIKALGRDLGIESPQNRRSHGGTSGAVSQSRDQDRRKRMRRTAVQIARHYACNIDKCNKSYGSQGSLNQHIKLKHKYYYTKHLMLLDIREDNHSQQQ